MPSILCVVFSVVSLPSFVRDPSGLGRREFVLGRPALRIVIVVGKQPALPVGLLEPVLLGPRAETLLGGVHCDWLGIRAAQVGQTQLFPVFSGPWMVWDLPAFGWSPDCR